MCGVAVQNQPLDVDMRVIIVSRLSYDMIALAMDRKASQKEHDLNRATMTALRNGIDEALAAG